MKTEAPTPETILYVARRMREADVREFLGVSWCENRHQLAEHLVKTYGEHPAVICFASDVGEPIGVGAMVPGRPNVCTMLFFATDMFPSIALGVARFTKRRLFPRYRDAGVHRIEAISIDGHHDAHRWIEIVGLEREASLRGYGKGGETYHQFAWVRDDLR